MDRPDWKSPLERAYRAALAYLESLPGRPVLARLTAEAVLESIDGPVPDGPMAAERVLEELVQKADPGLTAMPGGRFFGWVIGGSLPAALGADWLTSAWDQNAGSPEATPAAAAFEQVALRWVKELLDLPSHASGALVTGGQMANTVCLAAARQRVLEAAGWDVEERGLPGAPPVTVLVGDERHDTVVRSLRLLGLGQGSARAVAADGQGRLRPDQLESALARMPHETPVIICAQAGNVNSGAVDPLDAIAAVLERHRALGQARGASPALSWLHVDGAFGLWARASRQLRGLCDGAERADSWATDAHKWPNTPYDCGIALCAHPQAHLAAMAIHAAYLPRFEESAVRTPYAWTPELSRRGRGFALYAALRQLGRQGMERQVERTCEHARRFARLLGGAPGSGC
jgi:glutamate/tyrosine decarboxylase-like PLP-dependent enzyme